MKGNKQENEDVGLKIDSPLDKQILRRQKGAVQCLVWNWDIEIYNVLAPKSFTSKVSSLPLHFNTPIV